MPEQKHNLPPGTPITVVNHAPPPGARHRTSQEDKGKEQHSIECATWGREAIDDERRRCVTGGLQTTGFTWGPKVSTGARQRPPRRRRSRHVKAVGAEGGSGNRKYNGHSGGQGASQR